MISDEQVLEMINRIVKRQLTALEEVANEENIQLDEDPKQILLKEIQKQFKMTLDNLQKLYDEFIDTENCTLGAALQYVPLFTVYGLTNAAQLGVTQEEYYLIVDYYLDKWNMFEENQK